MYSSSLKLNDDSCSKRYGYICQATGSTCVSCPPHSSSPLESTSLSACKCDPGFTGPNGGPCSQCTAGTYKSSFGDSACDSCPLDSMSPVGSDSASDCVCSGGFQGPTTPIVDNGGSGCTSDNQCSACQGDCDSDSDCQPGLKCWQRSQPDQTVPGCAKTGYVQSTADHDYCYDPTLACASCGEDTYKPSQLQVGFELQGVGYCSADPTDMERKVNGRFKHGVPSEADCATACRSVDACVGYSYSISSQFPRGGCFLYGSGLEAGLPAGISGSYSGNVHCAYENEECACTGVVRYGDPASNTWSATERHVSGSISC